MKLLKLFLAGSLITSTSTLVWAGKKDLFDQENLPPEYSTNIINKQPALKDGQPARGKNKTHKRKSKKKREALRKQAEKKKVSAFHDSKNVQKMPSKEKEVSHKTEKEKTIFVQEESPHTLQSSTPLVTEDCSFLDNHMKSFCQKLETAHKAVNVKEILDVYHDFSSLDFPAEMWKAYRLRQGIYQWPRQQDDKQAVGGDLFFPKWAHEWADSFEQKKLLKRKDMVQTFAIGAKLNNPVSLYYFVNTLETIRTDFSLQDTPDLLYQFYQQAFKDLEQCTDHHILGWNTWRPPHLLRSNSEKAFNLHTKGGDLRNRLQVLELRSIRGGTRFTSFTKATLEDYLEVAREGYGPAYLKAAELATDPETKVSILKEALEKGYTPAFIEMGSLHGMQGNLEEERKYYEDAAQAGISEGYVDLGRTYVGNIMSPSREKVEALTEEQIEKAEYFFWLAGEAQDPNGWDHLARLYSVLLPNKQIAKEKGLYYC
jgi:hypothetical protein